MDDNYANGGMNSEQEGGESVPCVHLYVMPDGSYKVSQSEGPVPGDAQDAGGMDEAMEMVRQMAEGGAPETEGDEMQAAQAGYAKKAQPKMDAPNPGAIFGE
jgi:hypothetical protein